MRLIILLSLVVYQTMWMREEKLHLQHEEEDKRKQDAIETEG